MINITRFLFYVQVNASPSLSANTKEDYAMKCEMLNGD